MKILASPDGNLLGATYTSSSLRHGLQPGLPDIFTTFLAGAVTAIGDSAQRGLNDLDGLGGFIADGIDHFVVLPLLGLLGGIAGVGPGDILLYVREADLQFRKPLFQLLSNTVVSHSNYPAINIR